MLCIHVKPEALREIMTSFMRLDGVMSFLRLKEVTNTCKRMQNSLSIGRSSPVQ